MSNVKPSFAPSDSNGTILGAFFGWPAVPPPTEGTPAASFGFPFVDPVFPLFDRRLGRTARDQEPDDDCHDGREPTPSTYHA